MGPSGRPTDISTQLKRGRGPHHLVEVDVDWYRLDLPSFTVESTLSSPYSRFDLLLSRQDAAFAHFDSLPLTIWCSGQTVLFLFFLAKAALAYLPTPLCEALRPLFPFQQAPFAQVSLLKSAPFCTLFASFGSTNKSATSFLLLSDSCSVLSSIFPVTSISVVDLAGIVFSLLFYQATMGPRTLVSPGKRRG